jgi:hypothetical protein
MSETNHPTQLQNVPANVLSPPTPNTNPEIPTDVEVARPVTGSVAN